MKRLDATTIDGLVARLGTLQADSPRRWGSMTPSRMMAHVRKTLQVSAGEVPVEFRQSFFLWLTAPITYRLMTSGWVPWPRGKVKAPPSTAAPAAGDFDTERSELEAAMATFIRVCEADPRRRTVPHPIFGMLTMKQFARLHLFHINHHFRQFGI